MAVRKILIANRGEIACRIARTCRWLGIGAATVHSDADANARHVREVGQSVHIGGAAASDSYLRIEAVIDAARKVGADAIHPGFGFLSENAEFARAVEDAGLTFIGPTPETLDALGHKGRAKELAVEAGLPVLGSSNEASSDPAALVQRVTSIGTWPILLKAAAGGGGKGMRVVRDGDDLNDAITAAMREAQSSFGSPELIVEPLIENARHIEVQIAGDGQGRVVHFFERECSLQRRHQKIIEEAPAPGLSDELRGRILEDAIRLAETMDYRSVGTVEFLVSGDQHWFLEVNPRLQVEHPVTEEVCRIDLVALQISIASGPGGLPMQEDITIRGSSVEARLCAEDPARDYLPSTGTVMALALPDHWLRIESGVDEGDEISPWYDPMVAKLISGAGSRNEAIDRLLKGLSETIVSGVSTNLDLLETLLRDKRVRAGDMTTSLVESIASEAEPVSVETVATAALLWLANRKTGGSADPWLSSQLSGWRMSANEGSNISSPSIILTSGENSFEIGFGSRDANGSQAVMVDGTPLELSLIEAGPGRWTASFDGVATTVRSKVSGDTVRLTIDGRGYAFSARPWLSLSAAGASGSGDVMAPMMGQVLELRVAAGDIVSEGDTVAVLESMKMEMPIHAETDGAVAEVLAGPGDMVERGQVLARIVVEKDDG